MFGQNRIEGKVRSDGRSLRVVKGSPFLTIQGEGPYMGRAAVFLRLHGCNLRCWFCDTKFDDPENPTFELSEIVQAIMDVRQAARMVVITGGEPMRQNILPLCSLLKELGFLVQIETAGSLWINGIENFADVVCSPKTPTINENAYELSHAFKYVISRKYITEGTYLPTMATQPDVRPSQLAPPRPGAPVYLSPMDEYALEANENNQRAVVELAIKYNVIAGIQLHKVVGYD
jgi:organic radical activating enzyme